MYIRHRISIVRVRVKLVGHGPAFVEDRHSMALGAKDLGEGGDGEGQLDGPRCANLPLFLPPLAQGQLRLRWFLDIGHKGGPGVTRDFLDVCHLCLADTSSPDPLVYIPRPAI